MTEIKSRQCLEGQSEEKYKANQKDSKLMTKQLIFVLNKNLRFLKTRNFIIIYYTIIFLLASKSETFLYSVI